MRAESSRGSTGRAQIFPMDNAQPLGPTLPAYPALHQPNSEPSPLTTSHVSTIQTFWSFDPLSLFPENQSTRQLVMLSVK
ncbi:hypothetical protein L3X38_016772 [Prunus dulcis]|uniref:Uncharacterized protein n=1 Tax=Prunus dulcis TaxID=3755 RepID=A0AAD4W8G3_PRUDU|nr:hypothetical protein L3X38_016772 [Prunus dulcis]